VGPGLRTGDAMSARVEDRFAVRELRRSNQEDLLVALGAELPVTATAALYGVRLSRRSPNPPEESTRGTRGSCGARLRVCDGDEQRPIRTTIIQKNFSESCTRMCCMISCVSLRATRMSRYWR